MDDTIELFHRNDIRGLNRNRYYAKYKHYFTFIIAIATVVCILSFVTLLVVYKTVFSRDSQLIKNDVNDHYNNELMYDHIDDNLIAKKGSVQINHMTPPEIPYEVTTETAQSNGKCDISPNDRFDCNPDTPITSDVCASRGCCWQKTNSSRNDPPLNVPYCFYPLNYNGYKIINKEQQYHRIIVTLERQIDSGFPNDLRYVKLDITSLNDFTIRIKFYDPQKRRFEVPIPKLNINEWPVLKEPLFNVSITNDSQLIVTRKMFGTKVFRVNLNQLVFADQFLQLSSDLPSKYIYGLGEHKDAFRKEVTWKRYTMFNRDQPPVENINLYGSHPFYMSVEDGNGTSHGVLLFNSNAMDVILSPKPAITWRTIGGVFDFFVFLGPKPDDVVRQYTNLIGLPLLPPFWGLGFHLCRFGYKNLSNMNATFERNRRAEIPYDVQWNDIDAMHNHNDFSYDDLNFSGLPKFIENLHSYGMKYVPMFDCGISAGETPGKYPPYDDGVTMDIFVKNSTGQIFKGKVWNKVSTAFPDFTHPKAAEYWTRQFSRYHKVIPFDGSWIDMNEPSNFLDGSFNGCPVNPIENPHYIPGGGTIQSLRQKTLCMTAEHFMGQHYNIHNLYGISETIATNIALKAVLQKRPFIISRSTFVGHGHFGSHWDGDVFSTWDDMQWTIPSILNFNLFGIPLIGADICGFNGNTTVELCARWSQLGAFYPFSRNHNSDDTIDQDPAALGDVVIKSAKDALMIRYSILSYLYTLFYNAHVNGDTVVRPLFFEFPNDKISYEIETQFLWGAAFMIIPTLTENATQIHAYLPKSQWYDFVNYTLIKSKGEYKMFDSPITKINVLLRGGYIVPYQDPKVTTDETRKGNFTLIVALDENKSADGELYWDDGESLDNILLGNYNFIKFHVKAGSLMSKPSFFGYTLTPLLESVKILGMDTSPKSVKINGVDVSTFTYDQNNKYLKIYKIELSLEQQIYINWN